MSIRALRTQETRDRILDAAVEEFWLTSGGRLRLEPIAARAEVSVQTVLRHFSGKEALFAAALERETSRIQATRDARVVTDTPSAVRQLVDHYEAFGDRAIRLLAEEGRSEIAARVTAEGRRVHRDWCRSVFSTSLVALPPMTRRRRLAELVAVCDVYTWSLLRRSGGLSRGETERALLELLHPLVQED